MKQREVLDPTHSTRGGLAGLVETLLRRFKTILHMLLIIPLYVAGCGIIGVAVVPGVALVRWINSLTTDGSAVLKIWATSSAMVGAVFLTGFMMVFVLPMANMILLFGQRLKPWRGPYYSLEAIRWYIHNGITYMMRYTLLELFTPSPIAAMFYHLMGMRIGRGTLINTTAISDPSLITIGEKVTLGGSATIMAHYGQAGFLVLAPVVIEDGATIGLRASIMGGVRVGKHARVMPHSVVLPKTQIPDGETWGGVPAQRIEPRKDQ